MRVLTLGFSAALIALALAAPSCAHAQTWNGIPVNTRVLEAMPKTPVDPEKRQLGDEVCVMMLSFYSLGGNPGDGLTMFIDITTGIDPKDPSFRQELVDFWNANSEHLVCRSEDFLYDAPEPILHRLINMNAISQFYYDYLNSVRPETGSRRELDFNIIHEKTGQTVLDYIDHLLKTKYADDQAMRGVMIRLKNMLRSRGALTAEEVLGL